MNNKLLKSKTFSIVALFVIIALMIATFKLRIAWWACIDMFFAFMMVFTHFASLYLAKFNPYASKTLDTIAMWCGIMTVVAIIGEYIAYSIIF